MAMLGVVICEAVGRQMLTLTILIHKHAVLHYLSHKEKGGTQEAAGSSSLLGKQLKNV